MGGEKSSKLRKLTNLPWVVSVSLREVTTVLSQHGLERQRALADIGHREQSSILLQIRIPSGLKKKKKFTA